MTKPHPTDAASGPRNRGEGWWLFRVVEVIAIAIGIGGLLFGALIVLTFTGGPVGLWHSLQPAPDPSSRAVSAARDAQRARQTAALDELQRGGELVPGPTGSDDACDQGQNNYKVQTGYAHRCVVRTTRFFLQPGDLVTDMTSLDARLRGAGWSVCPAPLVSVVEAATDDP